MLLLGLLMTVLLLWTAHWIPYPRKLHRIEAYTIGVAMILIGQAIWLGSLGRWDIWFKLVGWAIVSGIAVITAHEIDHRLRERAKKKVKNKTKIDVSD